jgi:hypothetical protein
VDIVIFELTYLLFAISIGKRPLTVVLAISVLTKVLVAVGEGNSPLTVVPAIPVLTNVLVTTGEAESPKTICPPYFNTALTSRQRTLSRLRSWSVS